MSAALRLIESLERFDDLHLNVECFAAALLAPMYGRTVSLRRNVDGVVNPVSFPAERAGPSRR